MKTILIDVAQGMGVGQPMIPATLLAGYQVRGVLKPANDYEQDTTNEN